MDGTQKKSLSEVSQTQENEYGMYLFICGYYM